MVFLVSSQGAEPAIRMGTSAQSSQTRELRTVQKTITDMRTLRMAREHLDVLERQINPRRSHQTTVSLSKAGAGRKKPAMPLQRVQHDEREPHNLELETHAQMVVHLCSVSDLHRVASEDLFEVGSVSHA